MYNTGAESSAHPLLLHLQFALNEVSTSQLRRPPQLRHRPLLLLALRRYSEWVRIWKPMRREMAANNATQLLMAGLRRLATGGGLRRDCPPAEAAAVVQHICDAICRLLTADGGFAGRLLQGGHPAEWAAAAGAVAAAVPVQARGEAQWHLDAVAATLQRTPAGEAAAAATAAAMAASETAMQQLLQVCTCLSSVRMICCWLQVAGTW